MDRQVLVKILGLKFQMLKKIFLLLILFLFFPNLVLAQQSPSIKVKYEAEYLLGRQGDAKVNFKIKIKNLRSDVYVKRFTLSFPSVFKIYNVKAYGNVGELKPNLKEEEDRISIQVELKNPAIGKGTENNIRLEFFQKKLVRIEGNIWEIILPTVERQGEEVESYSVRVILPKDFSKELSLAKPKPTFIKKGVIFWQDVKERVLYATFGSPQYYKLKLRYAVENPKIVPGYIYLAFPPETLYQKVFVESIIPKPDEIKLDSDGNYLGRYLVKPKEKLEVIFNGYVAIYSQPRLEYLPVLKKETERQKPYLLRETNYWKLTSQILTLERNLSTREKAREIFNFVVNKLSYDFEKVNQRKVSRLGAGKALELTTSAVCTEFTDLFIALARENGIFAREIQGYGYSQDRRFRPLSLITDVLHAWPEYYDPELKIWVPVDPTWQDTSGIDYFSSLDFNHIAFVIHGKSDTEPFPAGAYKIEDRKDIEVEPIDFLPKEKNKLKFSFRTTGLLSDSFLIQGQNRTVDLIVKNTGNTFMLNKSLVLKAENLELSPNKIYLEKLAPYQEKEVKIKVFPTRIGEGKIKVYLTGSLALEGRFSIKPLWYKYLVFVFQNALYFGLAFILVLVPFIVFFKNRT